MSGIEAYIFSERLSEVELLNDIDAFLHEFDANLRRTRKGRYWELRSTDGIPFSVEVRNTEKALLDVQDDLLEFGILPKTAPFTIGVFCYLSQGNAGDRMNKLVSGLLSVSSGISSYKVR